MGNDLLFFPVVTEVKDDLGQIEELEDYTRQIFCEKKSVPQSEFFAAGQNNIKSSCVLIVNLYDYQDESKVKYRNNVYSIYRTYERPDENIELYCEVKSGG